MHRHGYKGRKLGRERDERRNLIKGLATSLVVDEEISTTLPKAKEVLPYIEKLITKAKTGKLHDKRAVFAGLMTKPAAHKLMDEIAPLLTARNSGHIRLKRTGYRRGDNAPTATLSFVDSLEKPAAAAKPATKKAPAKKAATKAPAKKSAPKKAATKKETK